MVWVRNIKEKSGVELPFPIIADFSMDVAVDSNDAPSNGKKNRFLCMMSIEGYGQSENPECIGPPVLLKAYFELTL